MGCPRLGLHISARAVRAMVTRFAAAFSRDSGQDRVRRSWRRGLMGSGGSSSHSRQGLEGRLLTEDGEDSR